MALPCLLTFLRSGAKRGPSFFRIKEGDIGGGSFLTDPASRLAPTQIGTLSKTECPQGCSPISSEVYRGCRQKACPGNLDCAPRGRRGDEGVILVISVRGRVSFDITG